MRKEAIPDKVQKRTQMPRQSKMTDTLRQGTPRILNLNPSRLHDPRRAQPEEDEKLLYDYKPTTVDIDR